MTAELRSLILADRVTPGALATVKTDGDKTAWDVQCACDALNITGQVHKEGPRGAYICLDLATVQRYAPHKQGWDVSGSDRFGRALFAIRTALAAVEPGLRFRESNGGISVRA